MGAVGVGVVYIAGWYLRIWGEVEGSGLGLGEEVDGCRGRVGMWGVVCCWLTAGEVEAES